MKAKYPVQVFFYRSASGKEPVREWLKKLKKHDQRIIGTDIKTVQFGWPLGMPLIKKIDKNLWEIRSDIDNGIARVIFTIYEHSIILLHGFIKKTQKTPANEIGLAKKRIANLRGSL